MTHDASRPPSPSDAAAPARARRTWRILLAALLGIYFLAGASFLFVRHWVWPRLDLWRPQIEARLSAQLGLPVRLGPFQADFDRLRPRLFIQGVRIGEPGGDGGMSLDGVEGLLSWRSLLSATAVFSSLRIIRPRLDVTRDSPTRFRVSGLELDLAARSDQPGLSAWLLEQHAVRIEDATVHYTDQRSGLATSLGELNLSIGVSGRAHRVSLDARGLDSAQDGPAPFGSISLAAELYRVRHAALSDPGSWGGKVFATLEAVDLAAAQALVEMRTPLEHAQGSARLWLDFDAGRPISAHGEIDMRRLDVRTADGLAGFDAVRATLGARWREDSAIELRADKLRLVARDGMTLATDTGSQYLVFDSAQRLIEARVSLAESNVSDLLGFARAMPLPVELADRIKRWRVDGQIHHARLNWLARTEQPEYAIDVGFSDFSFDASGTGRDDSAPGFRKVSGSARLDATGGTALLAGTDATLRLPGVFDEPDIALAHYDARFRWRRSSGVDDTPGLVVEVEKLEFDNADAAGSINGHWQPAPRGPGQVDLVGRLTRGDAARIARYLPSRIAPPVREWVQRAVRSGSSDDVRFKVRGDLFDFPFRDPDKGDFSVEAKLHDGRLAFAPNWPEIDAIDARLHFERGGMRIDVGRAHAYDVAFGELGARIDDFRSPVLRIEGEGEGAAQDMMRFVDDSPIGKGPSARSRQVRVSGPARIGLALEIPLRNIDETRVDGSLRLAGNRVEVGTGLPAFEAVSGRVGFSRKGIVLDAMRARWLGGEVTVSGAPDETGRLVIDASGRAAADGLRALLDETLASRLEGRLDYQARVELGERGARVQVDSELKTLAIKLPEPLAKPAGESRRFSLQIEPADDASQSGPAQRISASIAGRLDLALERRQPAEGGSPRISRGALVIGERPGGSAPALTLPDAGLSIRVRAPMIDLDAWRALWAAGPPAGGQMPAGDAALALRVSVQATRARLGARAIDALELSMNREGARWRGDIRSRQASGLLAWDPGEGASMGKFIARFERLAIPESQAGELSSMLDGSPNSLPALDVSAQQFVLGEHELGRLELQARLGGGERAHDWLIDRLRIVHPAGQLDATGRWAANSALAPGGARTTALDFQLKLDDAGAMLSAMGFPNTVRGGSGSLDGGVSWVGAPTAIDLPSLGGELRLAIGRGQFLKTDPGIAKLIGVINLQALPRRLTLDFRDVFAQGFAFDEIRGNAAVLRGVARTEDLLMNGAQARVDIRGQVDLTRETQSLRVDVRPKLDAGLASLAYAAMVNPAVGIGSFLAQMLLQKPLAELFAYEFRVEGDWKDPLVEERSRRPALPANPDTLILQ